MDPYTSLRLLLAASLILCVVMTLLVVVRKLRRDRRERLWAQRRERYARLLEDGDMQQLTAMLGEAARDLDAQTDLVQVLDAIRAARIDRRRMLLKAAAQNSGILHELRGALRARDPVVRGRAAMLLVRLGPQGAAAELGALLHDRDADVRLVAASALGGLRRPVAVHLLVDALRHDLLPAERVLERLTEPWAARELIRELDYELGATGVEPGETHGAAAGIARALGLTGAKGAVYSLMRLLERGSAEEQISAARALGEVDALKALPALIAALESPVWQVRAQAATALGRIGVISTAGSLEACLTDRAWWVRANGGAALAQLGEPGREVLRRALDSDDRFARDRAREALALSKAREAVAA